MASNLADKSPFPSVRFIEAENEKIDAIFNSLHPVVAWETDSNRLVIDDLPMEWMSVADIVKTTCQDNNMFSEIIEALASLCYEMDRLAQEAKQRFYDQILFYGVNVHHATSDAALAQFLPLFRDLLMFQDHCKALMKRLFQQLTNLYSDHSGLSLMRNTHFQVVFDHLGTFLITLTILDSLVQNHTFLHAHLAKYKHWLANTRSFMMKTRGKAERLMDFLEMFEQNIIHEGFFRSCIWQNFFDDDSDETWSKQLLRNELVRSIRKLQADIKADYIGHDLTKIVDMAAKIVSCAAIFDHKDQKILSDAWKLFAKYPCVSLHGPVIWFPDQFMASMMPEDKKAKEKLIAFITIRHNFIKTSPADFHSLILKMKTLMFKMNSRLSERNRGSDDIESSEKVLMQIVHLAQQTKTFVTNILNLQRKIPVPLERSTITLLCRLMALLKVMESVCNDEALQIWLLTLKSTQMSAIKIIKIIARARLEGLVQRDNGAFKLSALDTTLSVLSSGPLSEERIIVARLALSCVAQTDILSDEDLKEVSLNLQKLDTITHFWPTLRDVCNTAFLFWHKGILPLYLESIVLGDLQDVKNLQFLLKGFEDAGRVVEQSTVCLQERCQRAVCTFKDIIKGYLKSNLLDVICSRIEVELRLASDGKTSMRNVCQGPRNIAAFLNESSFIFMDEHLNISAYLEVHLERIFYEIAWERASKYKELTIMAKHYFGLNLTDVTYLCHVVRNDKVDQDLSPMEIYEKLDLFAKRFHYDMKRQVLRDEASREITIGRIVDEISTSGSGFVNTMINSCYKGMRKRFAELHKVMSNEHIRSNLTKQIRHLQTNAGAFPGKHELVQSVLKTKQSLDSWAPIPNVLNHLSNVISEMGNILGFVRILKSGLHRSSVQSRVFLDNGFNLEEFLESIPDCSSEEVNEAAETLNQVFSTSKDESNHINFLEAILTVFTSACSTSDLREFFMIIPPLMIHFVDLTFQGSKSGSLGDGFPLGLAFMISCLNQWNKLESINWMESILDAIDVEEDRILKSVSGPEDDLVQDQDLVRKEFQILHFKLTSAKFILQSEQEVGAN